MLYNKYNVRKANDEKVMHKVGKNWKIISIALLMAIGGTAVATNASANADSVNANNGNNDAQAEKAMTNTGFGATRQTTNTNSVADVNSTNTNSNITPSVSSEVQSLEAGGTIATPSSASAKSASGQNSNGSISANAPRINSNANSSSAITYTSNNAGSAASEHNRAENDQATIQQNSNVVNNYVTSLNNEFPRQASNLTNNYNSASNKEANDQSLANFYGNETKQSNYNSTVSAMAQKAGLSTRDYQNSVGATYNLYSDGINSLKGLSNTLNEANSYAKVINGINSNSLISEEYSLKAVSASNNLSIAKNNASVAQDNYNGVIKANGNFIHNKANYLEASAEDRIALDNSSADNAYTNSLANSLGYTNNSAVSKTISSAALQFSKADTNSFVNFKNASAGTVKVDTDDQFDALYRVLSDTDAMNRFVPEARYEEDVPLSNDASDAQSKLDEANANVNDAEAMASATNALSNHPTLASIFGHVNIASSARQEAKSADARYSQDHKVMSNAYSNAISDEDAVQATISGAHNPKTFSTAYSKLSGELNSISSQYYSASNDVNSLDNSPAVRNADNNNVINALKDQLIHGGNDTQYEGNIISPNASDYAEASNAVAGQNASGINSLANSASAALSGEVSEASTYAKDNGNYLPIAGSLAQSYANDLKSDQANVKSAKSALDNFYMERANGNEAKAIKAFNTAKTDLPNSVALANAYGVNVYNHAPKYVSVIHNMILHSNPDYTANNGIVKVVKGSTFKVLGVGIAKNGLLRYSIAFNGKSGFITADPNYTKATYLPAGETVNVTVNNRGIREFKDVGFTKPVKKLHAGTKLTGKVVAEPDSQFGNKLVYGAFTRIQLSNGDYVTSNTNWLQDISKVNTKPNNTKQDNNQKKPSQPSIVNFFD